MNLEQRLEKLERENRWMRRIVALAAAVAAAVFLIGQGKEKKPRVIEAERFVLLDREGNERAVLGVQFGGRGIGVGLRAFSEAMLLFKNKQGKRTAQLVGGEEPALRLDGFSGSHVALEASRLLLEGRRSHVDLSTGGFFWGWGQPHSMGSPILDVGLVDGDYPEMSFHNKAGKAIWKTNKPLSLVVRSLTLKDRHGKDRAVLHINDYGSPVLKLKDKEGKVRAMLYTSGDGSPHLVFKEPYGKVVWKAPKD